MTLTILDRCTGHRVTIQVPAKPQPGGRAAGFFASWITSMASARDVQTEPTGES